MELLGGIRSPPKALDWKRLADLDGESPTSRNPCSSKSRAHTRPGTSNVVSFCVLY